MLNSRILCVSRSEAVRRAAVYLSELGLHMTENTAPDITHVLLPVPSFTVTEGYLAHILADLPENVIVSGGKLSSALLKNYAVVDFLQDPYYLAENAAITASCTLEIVKQKLGSQINGSRVLIVGWGRIGKCLCRLFEKANAKITVAVRKDTDRAMVRALGSRSVSIETAAKEIDSYDVIINTVPFLVLPEIDAKDTALILELASKPGMSGKNIIDCRGLPNRMAPDASGKLIAETFLRLCFGKEV